MDEDEQSPIPLSPVTLPHQDEVPEVSMVEEEHMTGVTFSPDLWMQRRHWALEVLRNEGVRSVCEIGCGAGALLETLVIPPTTIFEPPIRPLPSAEATSSQLPSPVDSDEAADAESCELFITRLGALDPSPSIIPSALAILSPPSPTSTFPPQTPRWEELTTELWLGGIEKYNSKMEGYEAMVALEVIEHLDPNVLSRFGVVTMGTYRPRLLLVTTPNFDFNAKFPRAEDSGSARKGFVDPTGRTERVFRHSDHKVEMTSGEFREWAEASAADWGYTVELSGVGISSKPSFYPPSDPKVPYQPVYATQTAIFRLSSLPTRSPRSVRSSQLPFMPGSKESLHPHKVAGKFTHPISIPGSGEKESPGDVRQRVRTCMDRWAIEQVSLAELWGVSEVAGACAGSRRYLVRCMGGWGDCPAVQEQDDEEFEVRKGRGRGLVVRLRKSGGKVEVPREEVWGRMEVDKTEERQVGVW